MAVRTLRTKRSHILYDEALLDHASEELFSPRHWARREGLRGPAGGRGGAWFIAGPRGDEWVMRHYRRGGLVARLTSDWYLWTGLERTRPWREWRLLADLYAAGLPVPRPVAARVARRGLGYRGDLITERIPDSRSLAALLAETSFERIPWAAIGRCIRRLHDAGADHADLNAHNILINGRGEIFLVDFDRGRRRAPATLWQEANLGRLLRSLRKLAAPSLAEGQAWSALLAGYNAARPES